MGKFVCGGFTEMQLMFLETQVEYKSLQSKKVRLVDRSNLQESSQKRGKMKRTRKNEENQKNRAALVLLKLLHPTWLLALVRFFFLNPFPALV